MRDLQSPVTPEAILRWQALDARSWVRRARTQEQRVPAQFNWLGLADAAAFNARRSADLVPATLETYPAARRAALQEALLVEHTWLRDDGEGSAWLAQALDARRWGEAAIAVYDLLTGKTASRERRGYQDSAMQLRAYLMARIGIIPGDRVLGSDDLLFYSFDGLRFDADEARVRANMVRERLGARERAPRLTRDLQALRAIKNRLAPLALLVDSGQLRPPRSLQPWLELRDQLL